MRNGVAVKFDFSAYADNSSLMKLDDISKEILDSAFFVAGARAFFRNDDDVLARHAAENAIRFLSLLDASSPEPFVFSGTLNSPETIVSLSWSGKTIEADTTIRFLYDGTWEARWGERGKQVTCTGRDLATLTYLGLPLAFSRKGSAYPNLDGPANS